MQSATEPGLEGRKHPSSCFKAPRENSLGRCLSPEAPRGWVPIGPKITSVQRRLLEGQAMAAVPSIPSTDRKPRLECRLSVYPVSG